MLSEKVCCGRVFSQMENFKMLQVSKRILWHMGGVMLWWAVPPGFLFHGFSGNQPTAHFNNS